MNIYIPPLTIFGLPASGIIVVIVEQLKRKWPGTFAQAVWAITASIVLGLILAGIAVVFGNDYSLYTIAVTLGAGVVSGLTAAGIYDLVRTAGYRSLDVSGELKAK